MKKVYVFLLLSLLVACGSNISEEEAEMTVKSLSYFVIVTPEEMGVTQEFYDEAETVEELFEATSLELESQGKAWVYETQNESMIKVDKKTGLIVDISNRETSFRDTNSYMAYIDGYHVIDRSSMISCSTFYDGEVECPDEIIDAYLAKKRELPKEFDY